MKIQSFRHPNQVAARLCAFAGALLLAAGCSTTPKTAQTYYFFPPPPDQPRLQYLTSFNSEVEFRGKEDKTLMSYLTGERPPNRSISKPYGAAAGNKKLYVCDIDLGSVLVVDFQDRRIKMLAAEGEGSLTQPLNISVDAGGNLYVTDVGRNQVVIFDRNGIYMAALGKEGEMKPRDAVASSNRVYVADFQKHNVRVYDKTTHSLLFEIPHEQDRTNRMRGTVMPTNLALDSKGNLYVSDTGAFKIQVYDAEGNYVRSVGGMGDTTGQFARVKGIAVDRDCQLYAVDAMSQVTQVFNEQGRILTWFGHPGNENLILNLPAKVVVDYEDVDAFSSFAAPGFKIDYLVFVINQLGGHKVNVYGYGQKK